MADFRKLGKGAMGALGKLNEIAAAQREANLAKFLEPSKVQQRLYHGTTATEGGKGTEAIRRLKPSKEGALGSGVYLTPNTAHASGYTGIPNDEAIESMLVNPAYQTTGLKALNQRNSGNILPAQEGGNMLPVHAQLKNPLIIEGTHADPMIEALMKLGMDEDKAARMVEKAYEDKGYIGKQVQSRAQAKGHDGLMQYRDGELSEVVAYNPNTVKSAIGNEGTYDITDPDISKARGGVLHMADAGKVVRGGLKAIQAASKAADEQLAAGKLKAALEAQQAPMTTPSGTGLPLMPRDNGMYTLREQKELPRMPMVDKARAAGVQPNYNERMQDLLDSPKARKKVDKLINKGKALGVQEWYGTEPLRQVTLNAGRTPEQFDSMMAQFASASQRNPVDKQNQMGSYLYYLSETGQLPADSLLLTNKLKEALKADPSLAQGRTLVELPKGYGSLAQGDIFNRAVMIGQGDIAGALPPNKKLGTFYENLLGNVKPITVDVNALRGPIIEQGDPRWLTSKLVEKDEKGKVINTYKPREMYNSGEMSMREAQQRPGFWEAAPSGSEYAGFEDLWTRGAKRHDIEPAEAQALGWYGSADVTALKTKPENYVDNLERLIRQTAEQTGKSPTEVLNDMVTGKGFLRKEGGAVNSKESPEDMALFHKRFALHKATGGKVDIPRLTLRRADGGRIAKGLMGVFKKASNAADAAMAANKVLPVAARDANLQKFLAPSTEKRRMYHGSKDPNITEFKTRKEMTDENNMTGHYADERDAVFLSPDPEFTKHFSTWGYTDSHQAPTTYPVYVQVKRPFDFDNPEHLNRVKETYSDMYQNPQSEFYDPHLLPSERSTAEHVFKKRVDELPQNENNWMHIENPAFQDVLKDLGFDSFYTRERGTKNLGVYEPNRIKSATGNRGTYDLGESDITKADGGKIGKGIIGALTKASKMADAAMAARKAPQEDALRLAQQRAALPPAKGGLGLPVGNTAMDRARASGLDVETNYIHSTNKPFSQVTDDGQFSGIFTLPNYSANYGSVDMPLMTSGKIATSQDLQNLIKKPTKKMQMAINETIPLNLTDPADIADATVEMQKLRNQLAKKHGFDGVKISDEFGNDTVALVNPDNIRSRFAAFDPFRRDAATAAAMGVLAPDLMAEETEKNKARGGRVQESPEDIALFHKRFALHKATGGKIDIPHLSLKRVKKFDGGGVASPSDEINQGAAFGIYPKAKGGEDLRKGGEYSGLMAELLAKMAKDQGKEELSSLSKPRAATDILNRGVLANNPVSAVIDMVNMGLVPLDVLGSKLTGRDIKVSSEKPFLGSEYVKDLMNKYNVTSGEERPMMETALSFASPTGMIKGALKAPELTKKTVDAVASTGRAGAKALGPTAVRMGEDYLKRRGLMPELDVYHGSPHKFERFDASKIGTGEGNQAYGHGLYLAENRRVADEYAGKLSKPFVEFSSGSPENIYEKAILEKLNSIAGTTQLEARGNSVSSAFEEFMNPRMWKYDPKNPKANSYNGTVSLEGKDLETAMAYKKAAERLGSPTVYDTGSLYKVDLPDEQIAKMLDWDKHLSEQSPEVQKILLPYQKEIGSSFGTGEQTLKAIAFERRMKGLDDSPAAVSQQLRDMGIPGIKYLDEGSRAAGQGTRNFVTFPGEEKNLTILERNGQPLKARGGLTLMR